LGVRPLRVDGDRVGRMKRESGWDIGVELILAALCLLAWWAGATLFDLA
jgi:hypothetical protein